MTYGLTFSTQDAGEPVALVPEVDGVSLIDLVGRFETDRRYSPAGGYGGIVPANFRVGDIRDYFRGIEANQWPEPGVVCLLGCECGELGCWPLTARVTISDSTVIWAEFRQPHRPGRDYSGFGPFDFDRAQYEAELPTI
jgi:hypothetical protein